MQNHHNILVIGIGKVKKKETSAIRITSLKMANINPNLTKDIMLQFATAISDSDNFQSIIGYLTAAIGTHMTKYVMNHVDAAVKTMIESRIQEHIDRQREAHERLDHLKAKQQANAIATKINQASNLATITPATDEKIANDATYILKTRSKKVRTASTPGPKPKPKSGTLVKKIKQKSSPKPGKKAAMRKLAEEAKQVEEIRVAHENLIKYHMPDPSEGKQLIMPLTVQFKQVNDKNVDG